MRQTTVAFFIIFSSVTLTGCDANSTHITKLPAPYVTPGNFRSALEQPSSPVSPDGQWIAVASTTQLTLVNANGKRYMVKPEQDGSLTNTIYGETPKGDLLLGGSAGGGDVTELYRPGVGVIQQLSSKNRYTERASVSAKNHEFALMSNYSGGDPTKKEWVTVDGKTIPSLAHTIGWAWSPDGVTLAAEIPIISPNNSATKAKLVMYHVTSNTIQTIATDIPFSYPGSPSGDTLVFGESENLSWSTDGRYIGIDTPSGVRLYDMLSKPKMRVSFLPSTTNWSFLSSNTIGAVTSDGKAMAFYRIANDTIQPIGKQQLAQRISAYQPIGNGNILVSDASGEIDLWNATHAKTILQSGSVSWNGNAGTWWYNFTNQHMYYVDNAGSNQAVVENVLVPT